MVNGSVTYDRQRLAIFRRGRRHTMSAAFAIMAASISCWTMTAALAPTLAPALAQNTAATGQPAVGASGLPLPRFASLKSDRVNLRQGPGTDYPTSWVFRRAGLPVEIVKEFETWRQVRDADGVTGWVQQSLLSGRRTAVVLPWEIKDQSAPRLQTSLYSDDSSSSRAEAIIEAGVIADVSSCDGRWCMVSVDAYSGYIEQKNLWGAYTGEVVK